MKLSSPTMAGAASKIFFKMILSFVFCMVSAFAFAGHTIYTSWQNGTDIAVNAEQVLQDQYYLNLAQGRNDVGTSCRVRLFYTEQLHKYYTANWGLTVEFDVQTWDETGTAGPSYTGQTLSIDYKYGGTINSGDDFTDEAVYDFADAYRFKITITAITKTGALASSNIPDDIFLETEMDVERYFTLNTSNAVDVRHRWLSYPGSNKIEFYWPYVVGAEQYDLEWYFSCAECTGAPTQPSQIADIDFTRVTLNDNYYTLNLAFDEGTVFYRVRPVGRNTSDHTVILNGAWSNSGADTVKVKNRNKDKNWTYEAVYAEDGKKKEVLSLFDGSGRNRQVVTLQNTTNVAMVGESYYDFEGRGVIQTLPSPEKPSSGTVLNGDLKFYSAFSLNSSNTQLLKQNFDKDAASCGVQDFTMGANQGAGWYYSTSNTIFDDLGSGTYIASASGYPYTRTQYGTDGRVKKQSGVGPDHEIGSGHETEYFYATPAQEKLDRMFGNEVGFARHYRVTGARDANGQLALTYQDLSGKTIATSLVGSTPASLTALASNASAGNYVMDLTGSNHFVDGVYTIQYPLFVENSSSAYTFSYKMTGEEYASLCQSEAVDCQYKLLITVFDECNDPVLNNGGTQYLHNVQPINAGSTFPYTLTFTVTFPKPGVYMVTKKLYLDEAYIQQKIDSFIVDLPGNCFNLTNLLNEFEDAVDLSACTNCSGSECNPTINVTCNEMLSWMEQDMSPGGQYFDRLQAYNTGTNPSNAWLNAYILDESTQGSWIQNTYGYNNWNSVRSNWVSSFLTTQFKDNTGANTTLTINGHSCNNLLQSHPEYCHYQACSTLQASYEWDMAMLNVNDFDAAVTAGYLPDSNPVCSEFEITANVESIPMDLDPFYPTYSTSTQEDEMSDALSISTCLWETAATLVDPACTTNCDDEQWKRFRDLYLAKKYGDIEEYKAASPQSCDYLCDNTFPPDLIADNNCSPNTAMVYGFRIRVPDTWSLINTVTDATSADNFYDDLNDFTPDPCASSSASFGFRVDTLQCSGCTTFNVRVNGISITDTFNIQYSPSPCSDPYLMAQRIVDSINTYTSDPDYTAKQVGVMVQIFAPAGTTHNNKTVDYRCTTSDSYRTLGKTTGGTSTTSPCPVIPSCFCNELNSLYDLIVAEDHPADVPAALASAINTAYGTSYTSGNISGWLSQCSSGGDVTEPTPNAALLVNCPTTIEPCSTNTEGFSIADYYAQQAYNQLFDQYVQQFEDELRAECFKLVADGGDFYDSLKITTVDHEYHFTLYYYDQAGNLTRTVPPAGVNLLSTAQVVSSMDHRNHPNDYTKPFIHTSHTMISGYRYNSLNLVIDQYMPDAENTTALNIFNENNYYDFPTGSPLISRVHMFDSNNGIAIVYSSPDSKLYLTFDGGLTWSLKNTPTTFNNITLTDIVFTSSSQGFVTGTDAAPTPDVGVIYYINDYTHDLADSDTWTQESVTLVESTPTIYNDIEFIDQSLGFATGDNGTLIKITISGSTITATEETLTSNPTNNLICITKNGNNKYTATAYVGGSSSKLIELTDLDATIADNSFSNMPSSLNIREIEVTEGGTRLLIASNASGNGKIHRSANTSTSTSWTEVASLTGQLFNSLYVQSTGLGYATATSAAPTYTSGSVYMTTDYGVSWTDESPSPPGGLKGSFYVTEVANGGIIITGNDMIMRANGGQYAQRFWYDDLGRIKASQDARQAVYTYPGYSYTVYDEQGRITEAGEFYESGTTDPTRTELNASTWPNSWMTDHNNATQVAFTKYDDGYSTAIEQLFNGEDQSNLRSRVAATWYKENYDDASYLFASHYSYDIHGNVEELLQENPFLAATGHNFKRVEYDYDLVSGNVNEVVYQRDAQDQFIHRYVYDADNRILLAETSREGLVWDNDVKYYYYLHGPLARTELGHRKVQGMDYAYTIQGWLKGMNANKLDHEADMGRDSYDNSNASVAPYLTADKDIHRNITRDAFGFSLGYFSNDYLPINSTAGDDFLTDISSVNSSNPGNQLFNGNIRHMAVALMNENQTPLDRMAYIYQYDQLNRIKEMDVWKTAYTSTFLAATHPGDYDETYVYDANGNILELLRKTTSNTNMDSLHYKYISGTNKLRRVTDNVGSGVEGIDIDGQTDPNNYSYDNMGNLIDDVGEGIDDIVWNVRGKVRKVFRYSSNNNAELEFRYDAMGQRVMKIVKPRSGGSTQNESNWTYTFYTRDAQGNILATYTQNYTYNSSTGVYTEYLKLDEHHLYGSQRIGTKPNGQSIISRTFTTTGFNADGTFQNKTITGTTNATDDQMELNKRITGKKQFEVTNHLGNVMVVVSDRKLGVDNDGFVLAANGAYVYVANEYVYVGS
ncbi:MAG: RHS repeat domain-containing protein, partial [Bacteroidota bacterium]